MKTNRIMNYLYAFAALLFLTSGCKTLEQRCVERFPITVVTEVRTDSLIDTLILPDTFVEYIDTTLCPPGLTDTLVVIKTRTLTLPGDTIIHEYYCTDTVMVNRDAEKVQYLTAETVKLRTELKAEKKNFQTAKLIFLIMAGLVLALIVWDIVRRK